MVCPCGCCMCMRTVDGHCRCTRCRSGRRAGWRGRRTGSSCRCWTTPPTPWSRYQATSLLFLLLLLPASGEWFWQLAITGAGAGGVRAVGGQGRGRAVRGPGRRAARVQGRRAPGRDEARLRAGLRVRGHLRRRLPAQPGLPQAHRAALQGTYSLTASCLIISVSANRSPQSHMHPS